MTLLLIELIITLDEVALANFPLLMFQSRPTLGNLSVSYREESRIFMISVFV